MNKKKSNVLLMSFITTFIVVVAVALLIWLVVLPIARQFRGGDFLANRDVIPFHEFFTLDPEVSQLVLDDQRLRDTIAPIVEYRDGDYHVYLPAEFLRQQLDPFLFWDDGANTFFVSTRYEMLEFVPGRARFYVNGSPRPLDTPIKRIDNEIFLPADLVQGLYPLFIEYQPQYNMVVITSALLPQTRGAVTANGVAVRYRPETRAPITVQLDQENEVVILGDVSEDFIRVRTPQGLLGYIAADDIGEIYTVDRIATGLPILHSWIDNTVSYPPFWRGGPINLVWEVATNQDANLLRMQMPLHDSVTVVSPTWFDFDRDNLNLSTNVSRAYIEWAHDQGVYVWPKVFDYNNVTARAILMNRDARRRVINQLIRYVDEYNFDGINIDIEHLLNAEEGPYKIQFLRELAIPMRERGIVLSAAVKVPAPWTMFYRRDLIALTVDFVMVMTYDEHYATSAVSGPVASLPWVHQAVINMLEEVPREQLLMGLPFYNRLWREVVLDDGPPGVRSRSMDYTLEFFEERGVLWEWDPEVGSYYGEVAVIEDGEAVLWRVWLECERSITAKMQIYVMHDLAGVASWRRGWENEETWEVLGRHFP